MPKIGKVPSCSGAMNQYARSLPNQYAMQLHLLLLRTIASPFESSHYISQKNLQFLCLPRKMNSYTIGTGSHPTTRQSSQSPNGISVSSHEQVGSESEYRVSYPERLKEGSNLATEAGSGSELLSSCSASDSTYNEEYPSLSLTTAVKPKRGLPNKRRSTIVSSIGLNFGIEEVETSLPSQIGKQLVENAKCSGTSHVNSEPFDFRQLRRRRLLKTPIRAVYIEKCKESKQSRDDEYKTSLPSQFGKQAKQRLKIAESSENSDVNTKPFDIYQFARRLKKAPPCVVYREKGNLAKQPTDWTMSRVLQPGMVLLKNYISLAEQVNIVKKCRDLGVGQGGFYQPRYQDGAKLRLHMMCLGLNWDAQTRKYEKQRPFDNCEPPPIPHEFSLLVENSIRDSHSLIKEEFDSNPEEVLPWMNPDICIVNFYTTTGRLGLHQDRDESKESLCTGLPVVSFSVGDSAEFLYGDKRDIDKAKKLVLESGDVLIFGGKSRHVYHGVSSVIPNSAPPALLQAINLRPGRLNLTFRQN